MSTPKISFVFFGTPEFAVITLDTLESMGFLPSLVVTQEDKPQGRHLVITSPPTKIWAEKRNIPVLQPRKLDSAFVSELKAISYKLETRSFDVFIVTAYGKIIPKEILEIPKHKTLNIHPSLLPKFRGPSPIQETILKDEKTGVTIIRLDEEMDHGPIVAQREVAVSEWPPYANELETLLAEEGGRLLGEILPDWISGKIEEEQQNHTEATFTKKIAKEGAEIDLNKSPGENLRKIRAYAGSTNAYTFFLRHGKKTRVIIKKAKIGDGKLVLERVVPEGGKEMNFEDFKRGIS